MKTTTAPKTALVMIDWKDSWIAVDEVAFGLEFSPILEELSLADLLLELKGLGYNEAHMYDVLTEETGDDNLLVQG